MGYSGARGALIYEKNFLSYILLVLKGGPTFLIKREIIYRYMMAKASNDAGDSC
jgi:hypothetical protein